VSEHDPATTPPPAVPPPAPTLPAPPGHPLDAPTPPASDAGALDFDDRERRLDPKVLGVWRVLSGLGALLPLALLTTVSFVLLDRLALLVLAVSLVVLGLAVLWLPKVRYTRWRWRLTPLALELRHGVLVHRHEAVPYFRIQQIDLLQGPLDRLLHLATLQVTTASASGSVALPGISAADAPDVRAALLARAAAAVATHPGELQDAV
jgi:uncharacterized protein